MKIKKKMNSILIIMIFAVLNIFLFLLLLNADAEIKGEHYVILFLTNFWFIIIAIFLYYDISVNGFDIFSPYQFFILFEFAMLVYLRPFFIATNNWTSQWLSGISYVYEPLIYGILIYIIGHISLFFGYSFTNGRNMSKYIILPNKLTSKKLVYTVVMVIFIISISAWLYYVSSTGNLFYILSNIRNRRAMGEGAGYIIKLADLIKYAPLLLLVYKSKYNIPNSHILLLALISFGTLTVFGGRASLIRVLMYLVFAFHYSIKKIKLRYMIVIFVISVSSIIVLGDLRTELMGNADITEVVADYKDNESILGNSLLEKGYEISNDTGSTFDRLIVLLDGVPSKVNFQFFSTYKSLLLSVIPRSIWPNKPPISEAGVYAVLFGDYSNTGKYPAGIIGDYYLQMGIISVIICMFFTGAVLKAFKQYREMNSENPSSLIVYILGITIFYQGIRNLQIMNFITAILPLYIVIFLASSYSSKKQRNK